MNKTQEATRSMYIATRDYLVVQTPIWTASAGMTTAVAKLTTHINNIDTYSMGQQVDTTGVTVTKGAKRTTLISKTMKVSTALVAYGNATANFTLAGQAKVNKSDLERMADTLLADKAQSIRNAGNTNVAALADTMCCPQILLHCKLHELHL